MNKKSTRVKHNTEKNTWNYFDDCAICQGMKKAEEKGKNLEETELTALFAEQNKRNKQN